MFYLILDLILLLVFCLLILVPFLHIRRFSTLIFFCLCITPFFFPCQYLFDNFSLSLCAFIVSLSLSLSLSLTDTHTNCLSFLSCLFLSPTLCLNRHTPLMSVWALPIYRAPHPHHAPSTHPCHTSLNHARFFSSVWSSDRGVLLLRSSIGFCALPFPGI